jgi:hypothetical protein
MLFYAKEEDALWPWILIFALGYAIRKGGLKLSEWNTSASGLC